MTRSIKPKPVATRILRSADVARITGLPRDTAWHHLDGFPGRVRLTKVAVGWKESEVIDWMLRQAAIDVAKQFAGDPVGIGKVIAIK